MRAAFRKFLLLCLILALPLESFASARMLGCALSHRALPQAETVAMEDAMPGCHETEAAKHATPARHDCAHCAACTLASALPIPSLAVVPVVALTPVYLVLPAERFSAFIPDGPERPPRILAV